MALHLADIDAACADVSSAVSKFIDSRRTSRDFVDLQVALLLHLSHLRDHWSFLRTAVELNLGVEEKEVSGLRSQEAGRSPGDGTKHTRTARKRRGA